MQGIHRVDEMLGLVTHQLRNGGHGRVVLGPYILPIADIQLGGLLNRQEWGYSKINAPEMSVEAIPEGIVRYSVERCEPESHGTLSDHNLAGQGAAVLFNG